MTWEAICKVSDIPKNAGVAALLNGRQIALFRVHDQLYAIDNFDPISKANVLARGIVCSVGDSICVASPLYKQHFKLDSGECLEEEIAVNVYPVRMNQGVVEIDSAMITTESVAA